ncbi:LysR family transcriptional regulator, partial [Escherichia coli]|nr:LysR family transcriptional regulator [Escherichia coli]
YASRSLIVARKGHPLASATSLADLVEADWLMNPSPESSTQVLFNSFVAYGLPVPARVVECPSFGLARSL